jgi:hypothetical protein
LVPPEDKQKLLEQLYPFVGIPALDATLRDIHEDREFVVRDFKVVREGGMNLLVSPYYYRSGGSVIDWVPIDPPPRDDGDDDTVEEDDGMFDDAIGIQQIKPENEARLMGLMARQHEGPGL